MPFLCFSYIQIVVTQLKEHQQPDASTAENVDKDYKNQVEGLPYITAEFDYGKMKFRIGDGKYYSRSVGQKRRATGIYKNYVACYPKRA